MAQRFKVKKGLRQTSLRLFDLHSILSNSNSTPIPARYHAFSSRKKRNLRIPYVSILGDIFYESYQSQLVISHQR